VLQKPPPLVVRAGPRTNVSQVGCPAERGSGGLWSSASTSDGRAPHRGPDPAVYRSDSTAEIVRLRVYRPAACGVASLWQLSTAFTVAVSDKSLLPTLVSGTGHHLPRRAPVVVADAIVAFLAAARITDIQITQPPVT
jgi:hypothetical protein